MLKCGHHEACLYRYIMYDENKQRLIKKYCMACICEKSGLPELGEQEKQQLNKKQDVEEVYVEEIKPKSKKTKK